MSTTANELPVEMSNLAAAYVLYAMSRLTVLGVHIVLAI